MEKGINSDSKSQLQSVVKPWASEEEWHTEGAGSILIPRVPFNAREYEPIRYLPSETAVDNYRFFAVNNAPLWLFAILTSRMHMVWMRAVYGRKKTDYRCSFDTFQLPLVGIRQEAQLAVSAEEIIRSRDLHHDMSFVELYAPEKMPSDLRKAHNANDLLVDSLYRESGFKDDHERLIDIFVWYKGFSTFRKR